MQYQSSKVYGKWPRTESRGRDSVLKWNGENQVRPPNLTGDLQTAEFPGAPSPDAHAHAPLGNNLARAEPTGWDKDNLLRLPNLWDRPLMTGDSEQRDPEVLVCIQLSNKATRASPTKWVVENPLRPQKCIR